MVRRLKRLQQQQAAHHEIAKDQGEALNKVKSLKEELKATRDQKRQIERVTTFRKAALEGKQEEIKRLKQENTRAF